MELDAFPAVKNIQSLYLNPHGADVWFLINDERIPGHKLILSTMCPYYKTMFYGSLPENIEVDMSDAVQSVEAFREFLKFMYMLEPNLTMNNIEDVISLAKQSLSDECFSNCGTFLKKLLTSNHDIIFRIYRLALLYDMNELKTICADHVCVFADTVFKSSSLPEFPLEYLQLIMQRDALACEEIDIFMACMAWAEAACKKNNLDPTNGKLLRDQLKDSLYQIRFTSMTKAELSHCIRSYPGLFTANELEEIFCMVALDTKFQPKKFNWTSRYYNLNRFKGRHLQFTLVKGYNRPRSQSFVEKIVTTRFSCNRFVLLNGFNCELTAPIRGTINVVIVETKGESGESEIVHVAERFQANFNVMVNEDPVMQQMKFTLPKPVIVRPKYDYEITIDFDEIEEQYRYSYGTHATEIRVDHDITFNIERNRIVSGLSICRFDNKNYFQKVFHNPKTWEVLAVVGITGAGAAAYFQYLPVGGIRGAAAYFRNILVTKMFEMAPPSITVAAVSQGEVVHRSLFNSIFDLILPIPK